MEKRILIVDDNARIAGMVRLLLQRAGFQSDTAGTAREAIGKLAAAPPDLVLLDLSLPDLSGSDLLAEVRKTWDGPVIVVSASIDTLPVFRTMGAADTIGKPFDPAELVKKVAKVLAGGEVPPGDPQVRPPAA